MSQQSLSSLLLELPGRTVEEIETELHQIRSRRDALESQIAGYNSRLGGRLSALFKLVADGSSGAPNPFDESLVCGLSASESRLLRDAGLLDGDGKICRERVAELLDMKFSCVDSVRVTVDAPSRQEISGGNMAARMLIVFAALAVKAVNLSRRYRPHDTERRLCDFSASFNVYGGQLSVSLVLTNDNYQPTVRSLLPDPTTTGSRS